MSNDLNWQEVMETMGSFKREYSDVSWEATEGFSSALELVVRFFHTLH